MTRGILYIATGEQYIQEAIVSARSAREQIPSIPRAVVTDQDCELDMFDEVMRVDDPDHSYRDNVDYIIYSPFDKTIFLDSDTYICKNITEVFTLLERFDIAASHDSGRRKHIYRNDGTEVRAPDSFPMYNSGVIAFRNSQRTKRLFQNWRTVYNRHEEKNNSTTNQPALREALYNTDIAIGTLPPEYNCRLPHPPYIRGKVKILHGRSNEFQTIEGALNSEPTHRRRTFFSLNQKNKHTILRLEVDKWMRRLSKIQERIGERGYIYAIEKTISDVRNS